MQGRRYELALHFSVSSTKEREDVSMFTETQIKAGLNLAKQWYEGWKLDELEPEQLIEAIEKAPA